MTFSASKRFALAYLLLGLLVAGWAIAQVTGAATGKRSGIVLELIVAAVGAGAAVVCWRVERDGDATLRRAWRLIGPGALGWALGEVAWAIYELRGNELPFPSIADLGYLMFPVLVAGGLVLMMVDAKDWLGRVRALLDAALIAGAAFVATWVIVLADLVAAPSTDGLLPKLIGIAYPLSDAALVTLATSVVMRRRQEGAAFSATTVLLWFAMLAMAVADVAFAYLTLKSDYTGDSILETLWLVTPVLIVLAALRHRMEGNAVPRTSDRVLPIAQFVPYAWIGVAGITTLALAAPLTGVTLVAWLAMIVTLMVRQVVTLHENRVLNTHLEERVVERTRELESSERRFRALVQRSSDVVVVVDHDGIVRYVTDSVQSIFGHAPDAVVGRPAIEFTTDEGALRLARYLRGEGDGGRGRVLDIELLHADGQMRDTEVVMTNMADDPSVQGTVLNVRDVSEQRALEARLVHDARHDALTGLPNRALLSERLIRALDAHDTASPVAVLFIDLDDFKRVNDTMGHAAGDALLNEVARRLRTCVRESEMVCRLGGDEFAILIESADCDFDPAIVAERVCRAMRRTVTLEGREIPIKASIGIAVAEAGDDESRLLQSADLAMYRAKATRSGGYVHYDPTMHSDLLARIQLEEDLRAAIGDGHLRVAYQPIFALATGRMTSVEALLRWHDSVRGTVAPAKFISVAEESGLIHEMGRFVLATALRQLADWRRLPGGADLRCSVNVSASELKGDDLVAFIGDQLVATGVPADRLVLEITESVLVDDTEDNLATLRRLKGMGVAIAIDDFGTGYSSLSYLHRFPADVLKIDRSFVDRLGATARDEEFVRTIVGLGHNLGLTTLAEGIETSRQWASLLQLGCDQGQGRVFSMPVSPEVVERHLDEWTSMGAIGAGSSAVR